MCSLTPDPCTNPPPPTAAVEVFVLGDESGATRLFCVTAFTSPEKEALAFFFFLKVSHDQSLPFRKHMGVNMRAACRVRA